MVSLGGLSSDIFIMSGRPKLAANRSYYEKWIQNSKYLLNVRFYAGSNNFKQDKLLKLFKLVYLYTVLYVQY